MIHDRNKKNYYTGILTFILLLLVSSSADAQKKYNALNWNAGFNLNTFLVEQVHEQYAKRAVSFNKALASKNQMLAYRDSCRKKYKSLLGKRPGNKILKVQTTGKIQQDGYSIEKLVFESFANHHVTANLYIPAGKGPFPAALFPCGHEVEAKATESYQKTAILFAKNGFVVLMTDPISQGERFQLTDSSGTPLTRGGTAEHILLNAGSNLVGTSVAAYELWDNVSSLDYLVTRPEVDKNRIGCLGNSGGGTQTGYMIAYDERIKIAAPCSYVLNSEHSLEFKGPPDGCVPLVGETVQEIEDADYFIMFAPKPILILAARYDFVNYNRVVKVYKETKKAYTVLGNAHKIGLFTADDGHGITKPKREAAVTWFRKWLCNDGTPVKEEDIKTLTAHELNCTKTGQVNSEFKDELTIQQHNLNLADELKLNRETFSQAPEEKFKQKIKETATISFNSAPVESEYVGDVPANDDTLRKIVLRRLGEVPLPCLVAYPKQQITHGKLILWLPHEGKNKLADSADFVISYLQKGDALIIADLRGFGEAEERLAINDSKYFNPDYRNSNLALLLSQSLTGQRTQDVFTLLDFISHDPKLKNMQVEVYATGTAATAALYAAVFNKKIQSLHLYNTISSYYDLLRNPLTTDWYPYVISNVLAYYDLPDLVKLIGSDKVEFRN